MAIVVWLNREIYPWFVPNHPIPPPPLFTSYVIPFYFFRSSSMWTRNSGSELSRRWCACLCVTNRRPSSSRNFRRALQGISRINVLRFVDYFSLIKYIFWVKFFFLKMKFCRRWSRWDFCCCRPFPMDVKCWNFLLVRRGPSFECSSLLRTFNLLFKILLGELRNSMVVFYSFWHGSFHEPDSW